MASPAASGTRLSCARYQYNKPTAGSQAATMPTSLFRLALRNTKVGNSPASSMRKARFARPPRRVASANSHHPDQ